MTASTDTSHVPTTPVPGDGPLQHVRVVELGRYIAAPYAGMLLADLGAEVIKIEDPRDGGDPMRAWQGSDKPHSPQFAAYNRGKRSVALDLSDAADRDVLLALVDEADVLIENFRPGVMDRLGIGASVLRERNPGLVYVAITGFGDIGPMATRPAFDTVVSALSGLYSLVLDPDDPRPVGPAFSDLLSGMFATVGVLSALEARQWTGAGQVVEASMLSSLLGLLVESSTSYLETGRVPEWNTRQRRAQAYAIVDRDGRPFVLHLSVPEKFWVGLTDVIGRPDLREDPRFATREARYANYHELDRELKAAMRSRTRDEWSALLAEHDVPHAAMLRIDEVLDDPQVVAMGLRVDVPEVGAPERSLRTVRPPLRMSSTPPSVRHGAPPLDHDGPAVRSRPSEAWTPRERSLDR